MEFYSRSKLPPKPYAPSGEQIVPTYGLKINKDGKQELVKNGQTNVYEKIQASREASLIYNVIERYQNGDIEALNQMQGQFGDFTEMPENLAEAQQMIINAEEAFNKMPTEFRKEFNHNPMEFMAGLVNGKVEEILNKNKKVEEQPKQKTGEEILNESLSQREQPLRDQSNNQYQTINV